MGGVEDTGRHRGRETKRERKTTSVLNDGASVWHAHASWALFPSTTKEN